MDGVAPAPEPAPAPPAPAVVPDIYRRLWTPGHEAHIDRLLAEAKMTRPKYFELCDKYIGTYTAARIIHRRIDEVTPVDLFSPIGQPTHLHIDGVFSVEHNRLRWEPYTRLIKMINRRGPTSTAHLYVYLVDLAKGETCPFPHPGLLGKFESGELPSWEGCLRGPYESRSYTTLHSASIGPIEKIVFGGIESNVHPLARPLSPRDLGCVSPHVPPAFAAAPITHGEYLIQGVKSALAAQWPDR